MISNAINVRLVAFSACLVWVVFTGPAEAQQGLSSRQPMGAYLNGRLPTNIVEVGYKVAEAFPALRFKDPIRVVQQPGTNRLGVICQDGQIWSFAALRVQ